MNLIRLNKYISECGVASRRKADELISSGRVMVNLKTILDLGVKINPARDTVKVDGENIKQERKVYYLLNKPKGIITSTGDEKKRVVVTSLIKTNKKIFPVGRLDFNTTGVLILTNDGDFANKLIHPSNSYRRVYEVVIDKELDEDDKQRLVKGISVDGRNSKFISVKFPAPKSRKFVEVTTLEGRNHFVKKMINSMGYVVRELKRTRLGPFELNNLKPGSYRILNENELQSILQTDM